jgi:hypothetical protein
LDKQGSALSLNSTKRRRTGRAQAAMEAVLQQIGRYGSTATVLF